MTSFNPPDFTNDTLTQKIQLPMQILQRKKTPECVQTKLRSSGTIRNGATAVELALILPFFCFLLGGTLEIGRFFWMKTVIEEAALVGCRAAIVPNVTMQEVKKAVDTTLGPWKITPYTLQIDPPNLGQVKHLHPVSVTVSVPYSRLRYFVDITNGKTITGNCVLAAEHFHE